MQAACFWRRLCARIKALLRSRNMAGHSLGRPDPSAAGMPKGNPAVHAWLVEVMSKVPPPPARGAKVRIADVAAAFDRLTSLEIPSPKK